LKLADDEWTLYLDVVLEGTGILDTSLAERSLVLHMGPKGNLFVSVPLSVHASTHTSILTLAIGLQLTPSLLQQWDAPVADIHFEVSTDTCIDTLHIQSGLENYIEPKYKSMVAQYSALEVWVLYGITSTLSFTPVIDYNTWAPQSSVATFPSYQYGRMGLLAISSNAGGSDFIANLTMVHIRGSNRKNTVETEVRNVIGDQSALELVCRSQYSRECLITRGLFVDYETIVRREWINKNPEVCLRETTAWADTVDWLQEITGLNTPWGYQKLIKYMQHVCSFIAPRNLQVVFVATQQIPWPTFPPGVSNPGMLPDTLLTALTVTE
jgi:hypothetical protein